MIPNSDIWLSTPAAVYALGCSASTLKRNRDIEGGPLEAGVDYSLGTSKNSAITWNIKNCRIKFHAAGLKAREADEI